MGIPGEHHAVRSISGTRVRIDPGREPPERSAHEDGDRGKGGEHVTAAAEPATTQHEESKQMATLIRDVEALEVPHAA